MIKKLRRNKLEIACTMAWRQIPRWDQTDIWCFLFFAMKKKNSHLIAIWTILRLKNKLFNLKHSVSESLWLWSNFNNSIFQQKTKPNFVSVASTVESKEKKSECIKKIITLYVRFIHHKSADRNRKMQLHNHRPNEEEAGKKRKAFLSQIWPTIFAFAIDNTTDKLQSNWINSMEAS